MLRHYFSCAFLKEQRTRRLQNRHSGKNPEENEPVIDCHCGYDSAPEPLYKGECPGFVWTAGLVACAACSLSLLHS